jgi:hypothetical protein
MKNAILILLVMIFAMSANAQSLFIDNFEYDDGQLTATGGGANVSAGVWIGYSGTGALIQVSGSALTYSGYQGSGIGKKISIVSIGTTAEDILHDFTTQNVAGTKVFASFLVNVTNTTGLAANSSTTGDYFAGYLPAGSTSLLISRVSIRLGSVAGTFNLGIRATSTSPNTAAVWDATNYSTGTTYLIVTGWEIVSGATNDIAKLWVNPDLSGSEPTPLVSQVAAADPADLTRFFFRQGTTTTPNATLSNVRISTAWSQAPLPVELTSFTGIVKGTGVELAWRTATELNNHGFEIERSEKQNGIWNKIGFVEGHGTTNAPKSYSFVDASAVGTVSYRLKQVDNDGTFEYSNQVEVTVASPAEFALMQNHPNPFNPATSINYTLPASGFVTLKVYDMLGKEVATLVNGMQDAGAKIAKLDASQLPSGIYFYTLRTNNFTATKKMLLLK